MANSTRPWFPFNARDWLCDEQVMLMSLETQGAYVRLLCLQWENGSIPREPDAISTMVGFQTKDSRRYFFDRLWPDLKPHFPVHQELKRCNRRMYRLRESAFGLTEKRRKIGQKGGLQSAYIKRLNKQALKQNSRDGDVDGNPPNPPASGGDKISLRTAGKNPRSVADAEAEKSRAAEAAHRAVLIRKLEDRGEQGGAYVGTQGFKLWSEVTTAELEELTT